MLIEYDKSHYIIANVVIYWFALGLRHTGKKIRQQLHKLAANRYGTHRLSVIRSRHLDDLLVCAMVHNTPRAP